MYRKGFCPQCDQQIMGQDTDGRWCSKFPTFMEADLVFENQHRVRTIICSNCFKKPDLQRLVESILEPGSQISAAQRQAISCRVREDHTGDTYFAPESKGIPISIENKTM